MNYKYRLALVAAMVASLTACSSGPESRRQANNNFEYLKTQPLENWTLPAGAVPFSNDSYAIPDRTYKGEVGPNVDIRPPLQVLDFISGTRSNIDQDGVTLLLPRSDELTKLWEATQDLIHSKKIGVLKQTPNLIETDWVTWDKEDEASDVSARYSIQKWPDINSYRITLTDSRQGNKENAAQDVNKRRYSVLMTNLVMNEYDHQIREQARLDAAEQSKQIPISMGTDSSGFPVIIARSSYENMWERLPDVIQSLGFTVEDRNRSQGLIDVKYRSPDDEVWQQLGVKPIQLGNGTYQILLGDLGNRTSINIANHKGIPVSEVVLQSVVPVLSAKFDN